MALAAWLPSGADIAYQQERLCGAGVLPVCLSGGHLHVPAWKRARAGGVGALPQVAERLCASVGVSTVPQVALHLHAPCGRGHCAAGGLAPACPLWAWALCRRWPSTCMPLWALCLRWPCTCMPHVGVGTVPQVALHLLAPWGRGHCAAGGLAPACPVWAWALCCRWPRLARHACGRPNHGKPLLPQVAAGEACALPRPLRAG